MKLKALLTSLIAGLTLSRESTSAALAAAGPIDGHEGGVLHALKTLKTLGDKSDVALSEAQKMLGEIDGEIEAAALVLLPAKIEEKITAGEFVRKTDHDLALDQAKKDGEQAATLSFADEKKNLETVTARRLKLTTALGAVISATIPDTVLQGDEAAFTLVETEAARRVSETAAFGIDPVAKADAFKDIVTFSYDEGGIKGFDARIAGLESLGLKRGAKPKDGVAASRQAFGTQVPPVTPGQTEETKKAPVSACF